MKAPHLSLVMDRLKNRPFERILSVQILLMAEIDQAALRDAFFPGGRLMEGGSIEGYDVSVYPPDLGFTTVVLRRLTLLQVLRLLSHPDLYRLHFESVPDSESAGSSM